MMSSPQTNGATLRSLGLSVYVPTFLFAVLLWPAILREAGAIKVVENFADAIINALHAREVVLHIALVFPLHQLLAGQPVAEAVLADVAKRYGTTVVYDGDRVAAVLDFDSARWDVRVLDLADGFDVSDRAAWDAGTRLLVLPTVPFGVNTGQLDIPLCINMNPGTQAAVHFQVGGMRQIS